jgi:hypothetical protein
MRSPFLWFGITLLAIVVVTALGPAEKSLGTNVRVVYLHGAWVWTALICMLAAAVVGLVGLLSRRRNIHYWSRALGRTGLVFWITYLPLSLWAMQTNWNGLFLSEPRWRVAIIFAIGGLAIQIGITLLENPAWASGLNLLYAAILIYVLQTISSGSGRIQIYFITLVVLTLLAAWQLARIWRGVENQTNLQVTPAE